MAKNTNDLLDQLADNNCSIDDYLEENREDMIVLAAKDFWEAAIERSGMSKCNIINKADFNYCYFYDIVNGRKIASLFDHALCICCRSFHFATDWSIYDRSDFFNYFCKVSSLFCN